MRGRKPQPTALKILRGNPGQGRLHAEPHAGPLDPAYPPELEGDPLARAEWHRITPALILVGQVTATDRAVLVAYCRAWSTWRMLDAQAAAAPILDRRANGSSMANPTLVLAQQASALLLRHAEALGLTPSSRSRVHATPAPKAAPAPVGKWGGLLK
jgi:P27 family predicted phage terminase small subunit